MGFRGSVRALPLNEVRIMLERTPRTSPFTRRPLSKGVPEQATSPRTNGSGPRQAACCLAQAATSACVANQTFPLARA